MSIRVGVAGCAGRMGQMLAREVLHSRDMVLSVASTHAESPALGLDLGIVLGLPANGVIIGPTNSAFFAACDVVLDFTTPEASLYHAGMAREHNTAMVIGTTGLTAEQEQTLANAARHIPIVYAANMSVGVNMLLALVEKVAAALPEEDFDAEIVEMHHRHKVDAPSGTALALGKAVAKGRQVNLDERGVFSRHGQTGPRIGGDIGFAVLRGGDVVGDHTVYFAGTGEQIEIRHHASDRRIFAKGAIRAARWLMQERKTGLFSMRDVLGL